MYSSREQQASTEREISKALRGLDDAPKCNSEVEKGSTESSEKADHWRGTKKTTKKQGSRATICRISGLLAGRWHFSLELPWH